MMLNGEAVNSNNGESKMQIRKASGYMEISTKVTIAGVELKIR